MSPKVQRDLQAAVAAHRAGRSTEAATLYARVLQKAPSSFDALHLAGLLAHQQGRHHEAVKLLERARKLQPHMALCALRLGAARLALGELDLAAAHLSQAVRDQPDLAEAWAALALVRQKQGAMSAARSAIEQALALKPDHAGWLDQRGAIVTEIEGFEAAEPWFRQAVVRDPNLVHGWINLGVALVMTHRSEEALGCFDRALALAPGQAHALAGRGVALERSYRVREAVESYAAALRSDPTHHQAHSARLLALHYLAEVGPEQLAQAHRDYGAQFPAPTDFRFAGTGEPGRRLRVAILSPDLRTHSVAFFLEPLLAQLDRNAFEVHLYHDHPVIDATSRRLQGLTAGWHHTAGLPHEALVQRVRADAPDIALDLAGHTDRNRLPAFARRLAPVQIAYLGYPDTTGLAQMDFRLTDAICDPEGVADAWHTERLVRFAPTAWTYAPPADAPAVAEPAMMAGRPITFGCFNNFAKVSDEILHAWAEILAAVPGSRLLLKGHDLDGDEMRTRQDARCCACGLDPARIDWRGRTPDQRQHLALYHQVDVALDTYPYHGTTTTCEALWMGVPVVTRRGSHHAARVGASLLTAIGHSEWVATDESDYRRIAVTLAADVTSRRAERAGLRAAMLASPLLQTAAQAARLGRALRACWEAKCGETAGLANVGGGP